MLEIFYKMQPLDYLYLLVGIILFIFAIQSFLDKEHKYRIGTGLFWLLYSVSFIFGSYLSSTLLSIGPPLPNCSILYWFA